MTWPIRSILSFNAEKFLFRPFIRSTAIQFVSTNPRQSQTSICPHDDVSHYKLFHRTIALSNPRNKIPSFDRFPCNPRAKRSETSHERRAFCFRRISPAKKFHRACRRCCVINVTERSRAIFSPGRNRPGSDHVRPITGRIRRCLFTRLVYNGAPPRNDYRRSTIEGFIVPFAGRLSNSRWLTTRETEREADERSEGSNAP